MNRSALLMASFAILVAGCDSSAAPDRPSIDYRLRAENAPARIEKSYRLSETETVKVLVVPGFPFGDRCVIYGDQRGNTMQCREIGVSREE